MAGFRWGIMGTGGIAVAMTGALRNAGSRVVAVGSGRADGAVAFAEDLAIPIPVDSHGAVAAVQEVDIVYVATTSNLHHQNVLDCIANGKPVLCEKPVALNARNASHMLETARNNGVFVMEAMWMRFLPFIAKLDALIDQGVIGEVTSVQVDFMYMAPADPTRRWWNRELGGGSLLDLGIYPLTLAHHLLGPPVEFVAMARLSDTGVDIDTRVISHHAGGASAALGCGFTADTANEAIIAGTEGRIRVHNPFHHSPRLTVERHDEVISSHDTSYEGHGFRFEIAEAERCVAAGLVESPIRPHADTLAVMEWMDAIRARCGVVYDADRQ
jgi:predicted dehydrogenase